MLFLLLARLVRAVKNMSDCFSLVLAKNDLNAISNRYSYSDCLRSLYQIYGFAQALLNVGIDPHIFDNDNTSS